MNRTAHMRLGWLVLLVLGLVSAGCKRRTSEQSILPTKDSTHVARADSALAPRVSALTGMEAIEQLGVQNMAFDRVLLKGTASVETEGGSQRFDYRIYIEKGKSILAIGSLLGFEGARLLATPERCQLINRLEKKYYTNAYALVERKLGFRVDYGLLEDVLLANLTSSLPFYSLGQGVRTPLISGWLPEGPTWSVPVQRQTVSLWVDVTHHRPGALVVIDSASGPASRLRYDHWQQVADQIIPYLLEVQVERPTMSRIMLTHRQVEINPPVSNIGFTVPDSYERVD